MEMKEINEHADHMREAVQALCNSLEKHYLGITNKTYGESGDKWTFSERMMMGLNIELIMAKII